MMRWRKNKRGILGLPLSELIEMIAVVAGVLFLLFLIALMIKAMFISPKYQYDKANFRALGDAVRGVVNSPEEFTLVDLPYYKATGVGLAGFDAKDPKPEKCFEQACLCLYSDDDFEEKDVLDCSSFPLNVDFGTTGLLNGYDGWLWGNINWERGHLDDLRMIRTFPLEGSELDDELERKYRVKVKDWQGELKLLLDYVPFTPFLDAGFSDIVAGYLDFSEGKQFDKKLTNVYVLKEVMPDGRVVVTIDVLSPEFLIQLADRLRLREVEVLRKFNEQITALSNDNDLVAVYDELKKKATKKERIVEAITPENLDKIAQAMRRKNKNQEVAELYGMMVQLLPAYVEAQSGRIEMDLGYATFQLKDYNASFLWYDSLQERFDKRQMLVDDMDALSQIMEKAWQFKSYRAIKEITALPCYQNCETTKSWRLTFSSGDELYYSTFCFKEECSLIFREGAKTILLDATSEEYAKNLFSYEQLLNMMEKDLEYEVKGKDEMLQRNVIFPLRVKREEALSTPWTG